MHKKKPPDVPAAVVDALVRCGSLGRSGHEAARRAAETAYTCRCLAGELFDADPDQVVFTMNSSSRTGGAQAAEIEVY